MSASGGPGGASLLGKRLLLLAGAIGLALLLGWAALAASHRWRAAGPRPPFHPGREDPLLGWVLLPDWHARQLTGDFDVDVRTNAFGQRGGAREPGKAAGSRRIVCLGDSFTFGWGVAEGETFAERLGAQLRVAGDPVEIINAGVPGWNAASEYLWLLRSGFDWQPDLVLLQLCSNDLADFMYFQYDLDARNLPVAIRTRPRLGNSERQRLLAEAASSKGESAEQLAQELSESALNDLVAGDIRKLEADRRAAAGAPPEGPIESLSAAEVARGLDTGAAFQARYLRYLVDAIRALCDAHGVPLRLLLVDADTAEGDEGEAALAALCADAGGQCLPSSAFLPRADEPQLFFRDDPHWRPEGHRRAADALAAWLLADRTLKLGPP